MPGKEEAEPEAAPLEMEVAGEGSRVSVRAAALPNLADVRKEDAPGYDELINFPRARDKEQVQCVMCGRRPGGAVVIPRQNKDVCRECDRVAWMHSRTAVHFKWCKGCKRFLNLYRFGDKVEAAKCERCRQRGRQSYLAKKIKSSPSGAASPTDAGGDADKSPGTSLDSAVAPEKRRSGGRRGPRSNRSASQAMDTELRPPLKLSIKLGKLKHLVTAANAARTAPATAQAGRRPRSLSEGNWLDGRPVVFKTFAATAGTPAKSGREAGEAGEAAFAAPKSGRRDSLPNQVLGVRRFRGLSQTFGSPLEAFSEICDTDATREEPRAKRRKRAVSIGSFDDVSEEDGASLASARSVHAGRGRTNSVHELAQVAASMYVADFARDPKTASAPVSALSANACDAVTLSQAFSGEAGHLHTHSHGEDGDALCPALYELASVHTRIMKLEEDAQRVPGLLKKLSTQSSDLLHWRSECERLEGELSHHREEASGLSRELRELRAEIARLRDDRGGFVGATEHATGNAVAVEDRPVSPGAGSRTPDEAGRLKSGEGEADLAGSNDGLTLRRTRPRAILEEPLDPDTGRGNGALDGTAKQGGFFFTSVAVPQEAPEASLASPSTTTTVTDAALVSPALPGALGVGPPQPSMSAVGVPTFGASSTGSSNGPSAAAAKTKASMLSSKISPASVALDDVA